MCASVRDCIDELNGFLAALERADNLADCQTTRAYRRLIKQFKARQSDLDEQYQRLRAEGHSTLKETHDEIEVAWSQLEKSAHAISRDLEEYVGKVRGDCDSKRSDTPSKE